VNAGLPCQTGAAISGRCRFRLPFELQHVRARWAAVLSVPLRSVGFTEIIVVRRRSPRKGCGLTLRRRRPRSLESSPFCARAKSIHRRLFMFGFR